VGCCCGPKKVDDTRKSREVRDRRPLLEPSSCSDEEVNEIVSVELLEGVDEVGGDVRQWVNLSRNVKWLEDTDIGHIDRLSRKIRVKVTFTHASAEPFTLKMVAAEANVAYSNDEELRNAAYKTTPEDLSVASDHQTGEGGVLTIDTFRVPAAGGHEYHFEAEDEHGNTVQSHKLTTWRMLFLQYLPMEGSNPPDNIDSTRAEYRKHNLELMDLAPREMPACPIDLERLDAFKDAARIAYGASDCDERKPHVIAVVSALHAAEMSELVCEQADVSAGPDQADVTISAYGNDLWYDMGDDRSWFVSATLLIDPPRRAAIELRKTAIFDRQSAIDEEKEELDESSSEYETLTAEYDELEGELDDLDEELEDLAAVSVDIPQDNCTPLQREILAREHQMRRVRVRVSDLTEDLSRGRIVLTVRAISYWRGGTSIREGNIVCIATQSKWEAKEADAQKQVLIHELGHKIGMVPKGDNCDLDPPPNLYENRGHNGPHCHAGVELQDSFIGVANGMTCVMWGSTSGPTTFCGDCARCVKRRDLGFAFEDF